MAVSPPPLAGIKVLEFAGLAPGPYAGMLLADAGASVLRIDRGPSNDLSVPADLLARRKASLVVNLKTAEGVGLIRALVARGVDVLIDPFRPGVLERLGLGPDELLRHNRRLVYARISGFRRDGRYRDMAGHDINYLAVAGVLSMLGRPSHPPLPPMNMLADFAGGGATLVHGILLALLARQNSGRGQVVEANMVDGSAYLATFPRFMRKTPMGNRPRGHNLLDGGCPYYDTYATKDGKFVSVGAIEPRFFAALLRGLALDGQGWEERRYEEESWPELRGLFTRVFRTRTRTEWESVFDGTDACCLPVLDFSELETDPAREGDQRPAVALRETPCRALKRHGNAPADPAVFGQGPGIEGDGFEGASLPPGQDGEQLLDRWFGWRRGCEYEVQDGSYTLSATLRPNL